MRKLINLVSGIIVGIAPLLIAGILGVFIYNELQNLIGILICVILGVGAIWIGVRIFKKVQNNGVVDFLAVVNASPDLDNLEPVEGSKTKMRTPKELAELSQTPHQLFKGGTIKIFGDWHGEPYQNAFEILGITYYESKKQLEIQFLGNTKIVMDEPDNILESPSVLKILTASKVTLEFPKETQNSAKNGICFKTYTVVNNRVESTSNIVSIEQKMDAAIGQDALIIFN